MEAAENRRAVVGDNTQVDYVAEVGGILDRDYAQTVANVEAFETEAAAMPAECNAENLQQFVGIIKRGKDLRSRIDAFREAESQPHHRRWQAVNNWFYAVIERLGKRERRGKDGVLDDLQASLDVHMQRVRIAEEERRRREAEEARERERKAAEEQRRKEAEAEAARLAAERARKPETQEVKAEVAANAAAAADAARVETIMAGDKVEQTTLAAMAKPADMVRNRGDEGIATMARNMEARVTDYDALDLNRLRAYFKRDDIDKAVRAWARATSHREEMPGVEILNRPKTVIR